MTPEIVRLKEQAGLWVISDRLLQHASMFSGVPSSCLIRFSFWREAEAFYFSPSPSLQRLIFCQEDLIGKNMLNYSLKSSKVCFKETLAYLGYLF